MRRLRIQAFGTLQVSGAEQRPVTVPAKKVQALLAYLALHAGRQQGRAKLAALLWSESNEAQSRASLRQALLVLRKTLALDDRELVASPGETIELREDCVDVDVRNFEALLDEGTLEALEQATCLYTADLLEGLETREPAFDDWLLERRHHLRERAVDALSRLLQRHIESAQLDRAVSVALRLLA